MLNLNGPQKCITADHISSKEKAPYTLRLPTTHTTVSIFYPQDIETSQFHSFDMFAKALLLLALSLTTLSIPTTTESLNKRETYGWIGSYDDDDTYCQNGVKGIRPKMETACVTFDPTTQRIGTQISHFPLYLLKITWRRLNGVPEALQSSFQP